MPPKLRKWSHCLLTSLLISDIKRVFMKEFTVDQLRVEIHDSQEALAKKVAQEAHATLTRTLRERGHARVILATGNSQIKFLEQLISLGGIDWSRVTLFHMDEYLGISGDHKASFRKYMRERIEARVKPGKFNYIEGDALEPIAECERYTALLAEAPIDLCCLGIGENGHIAFNDPPVANFHDPLKVKLVKLDDACKQQQVGEGHFPNMDAVPGYAITLTIPMLCAAKRMLCISPETRKAKAVHAALEKPISTDCPASWLRNQPQCTMFLDYDSATFLTQHK